MAAKPHRHHRSAEDPDPRRVDLRHLAQQALELMGQLRQPALLRLAESVQAPAPDDVVTWSARGEMRPVKGGEPQVWLHVAAQAQVGLVCQRCLQPMAEALVVARSFLFVPTEEEAQALDEELDDDVLVLPRLFNLLDLLEDELILALPIVPRHEVCPQPLVAASDVLPDEGLAAVPAHPFAALAALKKPVRPN